MTILQSSGISMKSLRSLPTQSIPWFYDSTFPLSLGQVWILCLVWTWYTRTDGNVVDLKLIFILTLWLSELIVNWGCCFTWICRIGGGFISVCVWRGTNDKFVMKNLQRRQEPCCSCDKEGCFEKAETIWSTLRTGELHKNNGNILSCDSLEYKSLHSASKALQQ